MRNPICNLCIRRQAAKETNICIYGNAYPDSTKDIMVIIDNISSATNESGKFLDGQSGNVLKKLLETTGILHRAYITSAVKCWASHKPKATEIKQCRTYLLQELEEIKPKLVICLGTTAAHGLIGKHIPTKSLRQRFIDVNKYPNMKVAVTFSHNAIFINPNIYNQCVKDMQWIINNFSGIQEQFDWKIQIETEIQDSPVYGLDIETTGLDCNVNKILTIAIANPMNKESIGYNIGHTK